MRNFIELPTSNTFEEKSKQFHQSKLADRLKRKFEPKPFEENYKPVYYIGLATSYFCNLFSILTASTFTFTYLASILAELPNPIFWAALFSSILLILIEALQRILAPKLFRNTLQYGFTFSFFGLISIIGFLSCISILFSYNGGFDVVKTLSTPPQYQAPTLQDIPSIKREYKALIADAGNDAKDYRDKKLYKGRLSDTHALVYRQLLEKKADLQSKMIAKINTVEDRNNTLLADAKSEHKAALEVHQSSVLTKGSGLSIFTIIAQIVFFVSIFFLEYFDYKTASQYALIPDAKTASISNGKQTHSRTKTLKTKQPTSVLQQKGGYKTKTILIEDKHTIEHNGKRYTLKDVNNFINIYSNRVEEAKKNGKLDLAESRQQTLNYWETQKQKLIE